MNSSSQHMYYLSNPQTGQTVTKVTYRLQLIISNGQELTVKKHGNDIQIAGSHCFVDYFTLFYRFKCNEVRGCK